MLIIGIFFILPIIYKDNEIIKNYYASITAIGGFLSAIPIMLWWYEFQKPVLKITGIIQVESGPVNYRYIVNRVNVENSGRSAAVNCKGYFVTKTGRGRVCWSIPTSRTVITINAKDKEALDYCGFAEHDSIIHFIVPTENEDGWKRPRIFALCVRSDDNANGKAALALQLLLNNRRHDFDFAKDIDVNPIFVEDISGVLITAENAEPVEKKVRVDIQQKKIVLVD